MKNRRFFATSKLQNFKICETSKLKQLKSYNRYFFIFLLILSTNSIIFAQVRDTVPENNGYISLDSIDNYIPFDSVDIVNADTTGVKTKNPKLAILFSAVLPGAGQVYNEKYWKLPIIYAAFGGLGYFAYTSNIKYKKHLLDLNRLQRNTTGTVILETEIYDEARLIKIKDKFRRRRDLSYFVMALVWGLNIIDANVDAHFYNFDVSREISFRLRPVYMNQEPYYSSFGLKFSINF